MINLERHLAKITLAPYIFKAMALIGINRRAGGNMFRHQIDTLGILLDYKFMDPVLLKAAIIHDLFEDCGGLPGVSREDIVYIDEDGPAVFNLVMEVTIRSDGGTREPKSIYLKRVMVEGSHYAKILKLADRISNLIALGFVHDEAFIRKFINETKEFVLPYASRICPDMFREINDLIEDRENKLRIRSRQL